MRETIIVDIHFLLTDHGLEFTHRLKHIIFTQDRDFIMDTSAVDLCKMYDLY